MPTVTPPNVSAALEPDLPPEIEPEVEVDPEPAAVVIETVETVRVEEVPPPAWPPVSPDDPTLPRVAPAGWELMPDEPPQGVVRRLLTTHKHFLGLLNGGLVAHAKAGEQFGRGQGFALLFRLEKLTAWIVRPFLSKQLRDLPFPVQLRRRLEILGPTYIKLGQVLALRQDILPASITEELKNLLDRLPVVTFDRYCALIQADLGRPIGELFSWIDPKPLGSASIAQTHRATTRDGDSVILKVVKPGIRGTLTRDAWLLKGLGVILQKILPRYQPKRVIAEFVEYTRREVDLRREADNAETFAANFADLPGVAFPKIYREHSGTRVLCMEFFSGFKPSDPEALELSEGDRDRLIDYGAESIIRMIYKDGFFHADLHPGNLLILPGPNGPRLGFIDLGMVGRFDSELRKTLLNYFYSLVMGDAEGAARYLVNVAQEGPGADPDGFRRELTEILARWGRAKSFKDFSLAQLILRSVNMGAQHGLFFPVEMVLMVKALVTFEGVGQILKPGLDVASVSQSHANKIFMDQFSPITLGRQFLRGVPELLEALGKAPGLVMEGAKMIEQMARRAPENPFAGLRGTIFGGFCMVAGAVLASSGAPWYAWSVLFVVGLIAALSRKR